MQVYFDTIPKYRSDGLVLVDKVSDINVKFIQVSLQFRIIMTMFRVNMGQRERGHLIFYESKKVQLNISTP